VRRGQEIIHLIHQNEVIVLHRVQHADPVDAKVLNR
jgi:hypothetical protein